MTGLIILAAVAILLLSSPLIVLAAIAWARVMEWLLRRFGYW